MAEVIPFGEPENESERMAIAYLRSHLSSSYKLFTNLEIKQSEEIFEIDLILLAPHCVYVVDIKNWHGRIEIVDPRWYPDNYQSYPSPLKKLRKHAKVLSSMICDTNRVMQHELSKVHIQATVLMSADDVLVIDQSGTDGEHVTYLDKRCLSYFQNDTYIPTHRLRNIKPFLPHVERAILRKSNPKTAPPRYRDWQIEDKLGGNDRYTEYRARNLMMGVSGWTARLRVYKVDSFLEPAEREAEHKLISTAFQAVRQLPPHANILSVQEFFASHDHDCLVLVTEDIPGQVLRQHIKKQNLVEQKLAVMQDVLQALAHAHKHGVIHRNITPDSILISAEGQARLVGFDYARITQRTNTIADDIVDDLEEYSVYQAIECQGNPSQASTTSDLFSAGLVFYELLMGFSAFEDAHQLCERNAVFPVKPSERHPNLSTAMDRWLQKLCAFELKDRFPNADAALQELTSLATLPKLDLTNLPVDTIIDDRYRVIRRLGRPGSFGVAYQVLDTLGGVVRVLKLVTRDRRSVYERVQQEYQALLHVPKHPHIVEVIWAGHLKDDTPFIVFEYIEGQDVEHLIAAKVPLEQAVQIAQQTAVGLEHLHKHRVYHQDIKPSNLLVTDQGVRIIDFNVAIFDRDEMTISAGTRRYIPPDCQPTFNSGADEKVDRDLYALGITFYECVTGCYPFDEAQPSIGKLPHNPTEIELAQSSSRSFLRLTFEGCEDLSAELVQLLMRAIAPKRSERFASAKEFLEAIAVLPSLRRRGGEAGGENNTARSLCCNLFDASLTSQSQPDLSRPIVLDPTGLYDIPSGYIPITTEVEWLKFFDVSAPCWISGEFLCDWAGEWLRVWNKTEAIAEIKQQPRPHLESLFHPFPLPSEWTDKQLLTLATKLDSYPHNPVAYLLADITGSDLQIWLAEPSIQNLAEWLAVQVPEECKLLEQVWQHQKEHLATHYQTGDKVLLLRRWIGIREPVFTELGKYPLPIPDFLTAEFDSYWEQKIYRTEGKALDELTPMNQAGMERIAACAHKILINRPHWINRAREAKMTPYLSWQQKLELGDRQPPPQPQLLALDASPQQALAWATESYLPFRRWQINHPAQRMSNQLADSFVEWMLKHYPSLKIDSVEHSYLNYSVASLVQNLCQESPVLWVVVDGLGWLDHIELLSFLTTNHAFAVETAIQPQFSILPTKTEYAKWSLYTQLLPCDSSWVADAGKAFPKMGIGKRYTDYRRAELRRDLKQGKHRLYCWDTEQFDQLHHTERDWQHLYKIKRPHCLEGIAKEIQSFVEEYPKPNEIKIVIASDHGQILGTSEQITHCPAELDSKGRMAIGKTDDPRFVVLERDLYSLPHDISVVRGSASLGSFSYTTNKKIIGSHGGLFPEEVVVGVSVLRKTVQRAAVLVSCRGEGKPKQAGELEIIIENPNSVPLTDLYLYIKELPSLNTGKLLEQTIPADNKASIKVAIPDWPQLSPTHEGNRLSLSGELMFRFANAETGAVALDPESAITVNQMFNSGFDINEFF